METIDSSPSYSDFSPYAYLENYYTSKGVSYSLNRLQHSLRCYHEAFETLPSGLKILDYGTGASIISTISASTKASEIFLSDYTDSNRKALRQWLDGDSAAFDWSQSFTYVVKTLEGKSDKEVEERKQMVRRLVKSVVYCDITQDPPIEPGHFQLYDVVVSSIVVEAVARNRDEYTTYIGRLGTLVKPSGVLMLYSIENKTTYYDVGDLKFRNLPVSADFIIATLTKAGFVDITVDKFFPDDPTRIFSFIKCKRSV